MSGMPRWRFTPEDDWHDWPPPPDTKMVWLEMGTPEKRAFIRLGGSEQMERFIDAGRQVEEDGK